MMRLILRTQDMCVLHRDYSYLILFFCRASSTCPNCLPCNHGASLLPLSETVDRLREGEAGRLPVLPLVPADLDPADSLE